MSGDLTERARSANVDQSLKEAGIALDARRLGMALNAFRRAADASVGYEGLRRRVFERLVEDAGVVTGIDWRLAESMLRLAEGLDVHWRAPTQIWRPIERELCEDYVGSVLAEDHRSASVENLLRFRGRLLYALHRYPGEPRLERRLQLIESALAASPEAPSPPAVKRAVPAPVPETVNEVSIPPPRVTWANWNRAKGLWVAAAALLLSIAAFVGTRYNETAGTSDAAARSYVVPPEPKPELKKDPEVEKNRIIVEVRVPHESAPPLDRKQSPVSISKAAVPNLTIGAIDPAADEKLAPLQWNNHDLLQGLRQAEDSLAEQSDWNAIDRQNQEALAGFLVRHPGGALANQARRALAAAKEKTALAELMRSDDAAWNAVDTDTEASIEAYIHQFPAGRHTERAEQALAALHFRETANASNAVAATLQRYVNAWNTKDVKIITALHRSLDRRIVKEQLAPVTAIRMTITPASAARIDGERATIVCRRQVDETFSDGTEKQSPELLVTFTLSKRDGEWSIDGTR